MWHGFEGQKIYLLNAFVYAEFHSRGRFYNAIQTTSNFMSQQLTTAKNGHPSGDNRFKLLDRAITKNHSRGDALIEVLHAAQGIFGFLENDLLVYIARSLKLPLSTVYGVATFYHFFRL